MLTEKKPSRVSHRRDMVEKETTAVRTTTKKKNISKCLFLMEMSI